MMWQDFYEGTASSVKRRDGIMKDRQGRSAPVPLSQQQKLNQKEVGEHCEGVKDDF